MLPDYCLGIDVGGTKIASGVVDTGNGNVLYKKIIPTNRERSASEIINDLKYLVGHQQKEARKDNIYFENCGIVFPELVNNRGKIVSHWNFDLKELTPGDFNLRKVIFDSDVRAAGLAESRLGAGKKYGCFVYISLGTGLSYSLYINGQPWRGKNGYAIHFASNAMSGPCHNCNITTNHVPEELVAGRGLIQNWSRTYGKEFTGGVPALLKAAESGSEKELKYITQAADILGGLIAQMVNMLDPEAVVIGGGLGLARSVYNDLIQEVIRERIWAEECKGIPIVLAKFDTNAGIVGAALSSLN